MIKTKRQITTEEDRYGGYSSRPQMAREYQDVRYYNGTATYDYSNLVGQTMSAEPRYEQPPPQYLRHEVEHMPPQHEVRHIPTGYNIPPIQQARPYVTPADIAENEAAYKRQAEFMPLVRIRQRNSQKRGVIREKSAERGIPLSLILYISAVIIMATAVIASGLIMASVAGNANALELRRDYLAEQLHERQAELELTYDQEALREAAEDLGMISVPSTTYTTPIIPSEVQAITPSTNWFDSLVRFFTGQL